MKIAIINRSDRTGGAAVVSFRLMNALRDAGADARMLVVEKLSDSPYVEICAPADKARIPFLKERLKIFANKGFSRRNLFKADTASDGLPLASHPLVRDADAILLNWVNQGMLSVREIRRIADSGKPVIWTMHDMWCATGICHHAGDCPRFTDECGRCPLLGRFRNPCDLSHRTWKRKRELYRHSDIRFVAVSNWLAGRCRESSLMSDADISVIPNAFHLPEPPQPRPTGRKQLIFGAARLDDPVKGFPILIEATRCIAERYPELLPDIELVTFGNIRRPELLDEIRIPHRHLGLLHTDAEIQGVFAKGSIVLSTSLYETLPGTLIEGQAAGCLPVSFNRGGQSDIIDHGRTGFLADFDEDLSAAASNIAEQITAALRLINRSELHGSLRSFAPDADTEREPELRRTLYESVRRKFSAEKVAESYLHLINRATSTDEA